MKDLGRFLKDVDTTIYEVNGRKFVTDDRKWDGEKYFDCFEIAENEIDIIAKGFELKPVYKEIEEDEFEIVDFEIL